jgi:hypothetical protein
MLKNKLIIKFIIKKYCMNLFSYLLAFGTIVSINNANLVHNKFNGDKHNDNDSSKVDTKICGARIDQPSSIRKHLSEKVFHLLRDNQYKREQNSFPYFLLENKNATQTLKITLFPGNDCCQLFSISKNRSNHFIRDSNYVIRTNFKEFVTENGVKIGISKKRFLSVFSKKNFEYEKKGDKEIYKLPLSPYSPDGYVAFYIFVDSKLQKFAFGMFIQEFDYMKGIDE